MAENNKFGNLDGGNDYEEKIDKRSPSKNSNKAKRYLSPKTKLVFTQLRKKFTKALILQQLDLGCYIRIETNTSNYAISGVLSQLIFNNFGQWHSIAFYSLKK